MPPKQRQTKDSILSHARFGSIEGILSTIDEQFCGDINAAWFYSNPKSGDTVSIVTARHGNVELLQYIKQRTSDVLRPVIEQTNRTGKRPIHEAAQNGHLTTLMFLISEGADVNSTKQQDWTPLMLACTRSEPAVVACLLKSGADVRLRNKDGWNCFHIAAREGFVDILNLLLDHDAGIWDVVSKNGRTPLHTAALHGRIEAIERVLLCRCGYPRDARDSCGSTPLMEACKAGFINVMRLLITRHRANRSERDNLGRTLLHIAAETGQNDSINFLLNYDVITDDVSRAASQSDDVTFSDVNAVTVQGCSPLYLAAREGHAHSVQLLLAQPGIRVNAADQNGRTALHMAVLKRSVESVKLLLSHGARDQTDKDGKTAQSYSSSQELDDLFTIHR